MAKYEDKAICIYMNVGSYDMNIVSKIIKRTKIVKDISVFRMKCCMSNKIPCLSVYR